MAYKKVSENLYKFDKFPVVVEFAIPKVWDAATKRMPVNFDKAEENQRHAMSWGNNNNLCDEREALISDNNIVPQLLKTQRNITMGSGLFCFNEIKEDGKRKIIEVDPGNEVQDVLDELEENDFWEDLTNDFVKNALAYVGFKYDGSNYSMSNIRSRYVRPEEMNEEGIIEHFYRSGDWSQKKDIQSFPTYQAVKKRDKIPLFFVHSIGDRFLGNEYFPTPVWWTGYKWIEIGNKIPEFHAFNLENQYFTPLHIEIPKGYFRKSYLVKIGKMTEAEADEDENDARTNFLKRVDEVMAGTKNAGKAIWSEYSISQLQKEYGGIRFTPLKIPRGDDALLKLFEKTNEANISGTGVHPSLAAIMAGDSLSSGSEIRNALDMYIITQALLSRKQLLKPLYILKRLNGWDKKLKFGFRDVQLTTTDANPTGSQSVTAN